MNRYQFKDEKKEHLHLLDERPLKGTTTVLQVISKELTWWASGMACALFGWINPKKNPLTECKRVAQEMFEKIKKMSFQEFWELLQTAYKAHNQKKEDRAQEGTDLHAMAEEWISWCIKEHNGFPTYPLLPDPKLEPFIKWCLPNVHRFIFSEVHCYSERLWVGGKTDLGFIHVEGWHVLGDIKSRDKDYLSDHLQIGGYDIQLTENGGFDKDGNLTWKAEKPFDKHCVFTLGEKFKEPVFSKSVELNKKGFEHAVGLYDIKQAFEGE